MVNELSVLPFQIDYLRSFPLFSHLLYVFFFPSMMLELMNAIVLVIVHTILFLFYISCSIHLFIPIQFLYLNFVRLVKLWYGMVCA